MKKKTIIFISIFAVILIALICIIAFGTKKNDDNSADILSVSTKAELQECIVNNKIELYNISKDVAYVKNIKLFNKDADIEFYLNDDSVDEINVCYVLFQTKSGDEGENDADVFDEVPIYQFTADDKENINKAFENIKEGFEKYIGCSFEGYDIVPIKNTENLDNSEDDFFGGEFLKEYSVRDNNGTLWIMRYEASFGSASTIIYKLVNETGFEGFIPRIDLTKK